MDEGDGDHDLVKKKLKVRKKRSDSRKEGSEADAVI